MWKEIPEFSRYEISDNNCGIRRKNDKYILSRKPCPSKGGYICYNLINNQKDRKSVKEHRLVAITFISNPLNKPQVNHMQYQISNGVHKKKI